MSHLQVNEDEQRKFVIENEAVCNIFYINNFQGSFQHNLKYNSEKKFKKKKQQLKNELFRNPNIMHNKMSTLHLQYMTYCVVTTVHGIFGIGVARRRGYGYHYFSTVFFALLYEEFFDLIYIYIYIRKIKIFVLLPCGYSIGIGFGIGLLLISAANCIIKLFHY